MEIERDQEIRELAYKIWQEEGCSHGYDVQQWLRAKMIWEEINHPQSEPKQSKALNKTKSTKIPAAKTKL
jgi:hypothetical protein